jgi:hypothetical protein
VVFDALRLPGAPPHRLAPTERWYSSLFCLCLLAGSCALASFGFACATPLAAFAVVAADMLPQALLVMTAVWIVNQSIGFAALGYPLDASTLLWGFAIGVGALAATAEASVLVRSPIGSNQNAPAALGLAFCGRLFGLRGRVIRVHATVGRSRGFYSAHHSSPWSTQSVVVDWFVRRLRRMPPFGRRQSALYSVLVPDQRHG